MEVPFPKSLDPLECREVEEDHCGTEAEAVPTFRALRRFMKKSQR